MKNKPFKAVRSWINHHTLITCKAQGFPVPEITWSRKGNVESSIEFQTRDSTLSFTPREAGDFGAYVCTARNLLGIAKEEFVIQELCKFGQFALSCDSGEGLNASNMTLIRFQNSMPHEG